ncbi:hypothetical protein TNIN_336381 [Trichonephila inaurata madagascariensis]|uniref:Uncharacterized protein n=1 Tax=Trichonephila inaurata madagascariensis TaxID=2747483 RepID=A0A8X6WXU4_9ARAC|nr:hypothetical protein TNIN_336381 [Trichonephila inaurata madagascariensis]
MQSPDNFNFQGSNSSSGRSNPLTKQVVQKIVPSSRQEIPAVEESFPQLTEQQDSLQGFTVWTSEQPDDLRTTAFNFPLHLLLPHSIPNFWRRFRLLKSFVRFRFSAQKIL